jgi:hypothetical protein
MPGTNLELAKQYLSRLSAGADADELESFFSRDFIQEEFPNRLIPNGATRDLTAMKAARARGKALLQAGSNGLSAYTVPASLRGR